MAREQQNFADSVMRRYAELGSGTLVEKSLQHEAKTLRASAARTEPMGHPDFADLGIGEQGSISAVAMFLDLRRFTSRSFWDDSSELIRLNVAVLTELAEAVQRHGGYVLGLRGDGVFACFDGRPQVDDRLAAGMAVTAGAFAMDAVRNSLNTLLQASGIEPVQVRVGLDYGRLDFVRIGSALGSEVNVVGFAANFAAKCEKTALAWEMVAGQELASLLPSADVSRHAKSPAEYTRAGATKRYDFYDVAWTRYLTHVDGIADALQGRPLAAIGVR